MPAVAPGEAIFAAALDHLRELIEADGFMERAADKRLERFRVARDPS